MPNTRRKKEAPEVAQRAETHRLKEDYLTRERRDLLDPLRVMAFLPIRPYHVIADVYCGSGYFTIPLAKYLFDGKVYAVDPEAGLLEEVKKKAGEVHLTNIETHQGGMEDLPALPEGLDGAFLAFVLSEVGDREALLRAVLDRLKKGGWTAILEWHKRETPEGPPVERCLSPEEVMEVARRSGFRFSERRDLSSKHYLVVVRR